MLLLCGKSCTGKSTIIEELRKLGIKEVVSYSTRPPRPGEVDGIAYHFITKEEFFEKEKQGFFAETTSYNVASGETWHYGSAMEDLTDDKVIIVNPHGLKQIRKMKQLNPIAFHIIASKTTIMDRAKKRGDNTDEVLRSLIADDFDFEDINSYIDFAFRSDLGLSPKVMAEMILYTYRKTMEDKNN
ncbi:MAG: hypothetical protein HFI10_05770 [Lachnospiraceae bacterium]|jgi:guanylate kinase|nr:hypothetical protein [Lachnospiraceae bacterium]